MNTASLIARARVVALLLPVFALFSTAQVACGGKILDDFSGTSDQETYGTAYGNPYGGGYGGYGGSGYGGSSGNGGYGGYGGHGGHGGYGGHGGKGYGGGH